MDGRRPGFAAEFRDAVTPRAALLVTAVLLLQFGFIASYIGALHHPRPHHLSIAVVAPPQGAARLVGALTSVPGDAVRASTAPDRPAAEARIREQRLYAAWVVDPAGTEDTLLVADARGPAAATAAEQIVTAVAQHQGRTVRVQNLVPLAEGDGKGLSAFYLVVGWCVGGYLVASILGVSAGARPANPARALIRLGTLALYSIAAGLGGTLIAGPVLDALPGSIAGLWGLGALVVFAVGAFTMAMQCLVGIIGIGLAVLVFVVLGNPSAGGVYPPPLLPPFWRAIGSWLPNGAGTSAARSIAYFDGGRLLGPLLVLAVWAAVGVAVTAATVRLRPATR